MNLKYLAVISGLIIFIQGCATVPAEKKTAALPEVKTTTVEKKETVPVTAEVSKKEVQAPAPVYNVFTPETKTKAEEKIMAKTVVSVGDKIEVEYEGSLKDGRIFDSSKDRAPLGFTVGAGQMIKGFDSGVVGMKLAEERILNIKASEAYGERDEKMIQKFPKDFFPKDYKLEKGAEVGLRHQNGQPMQAVIVDIVADGVLLDFYHFLAGKDLIFKIKVVSIK